jgi:enediyne biosynthesis protein E4
VKGPAQRLASLGLLAACAVSAGAQIRFEDVTRKAGLHFVLHNGAAGDFHQIELMPGGVAAFDFNNDGCTDVFFTNGATSPSLEKNSPAFWNRLYRNNCNGTFTDVTEKAGVAGAGYSIGVAAADYDNDGFSDLFVTGVNGNTLYHNNGNGTFTDMTRKAGLAGVAPPGKNWAIAAGWFDADNDGFLDLVVTYYVEWNAAAERPCGTGSTRTYCHPREYAGLPNRIFRNNHDGTFSDMTAKSGLGAANGKGMGLAFADFDGDGLMDIFIANDTMPNFLFHNLGGFRFREAGIEMGVALPESGRPVAFMGADFRDFDNDGWPDLVVTGMVNDSYPLFRNLGRLAGFEDFTAKGGLAAATRRLTGWATGFFDFDNDGWKDLFFANAHFPELGNLLGTPAALPNSLFRNTGGRFEDISTAAGPAFQSAAFNRGAAFADFDNDGKVDVIVTAIGSEARLLRNVTPTTNHWLAFRLRGTKSNRDGIGARVRVTLPSGKTLFNHATTSVGYASSSEPVVRFGLGAEDRAKAVEITWPSGTVQHLTDVAGGRVVAVREP